jgi:predicted amidohydrolase
MDLNPWEYKAPHSAYEFANYILRNDSELILILMAWLYPAELDRKCMAFSESTLMYWMKRLDPIVWDTRIRVVVCCNRTGEEEGAVYAGTSAVCRVGNGEVHLLSVMGREEGVITVDVAL